MFRYKLYIFLLKAQTLVCFMDTLQQRNMKCGRYYWHRNGIFLELKNLAGLYTETVVNGSFICSKELRFTLNNIAMNIFVDLRNFRVGNIQL